MKLLIFFWIILILVFFSSCRTPSKERFEKIIGIELSDSIKVIEDKFEESGSDYGLTYVIIISKKDCLNLSNYIESSKKWSKKETVWEFHETIDGIMYDIIFSGSECKITYDETLI